MQKAWSPCREGDFSSGCETQAGTQLWSDSWDGSSADIFDFQDEITARVALSFEPAIRQAEVLQSRRKRPGSLDAHDLVLQALPHLCAMRPQDNSVALSSCGRADVAVPDFKYTTAFHLTCALPAIPRAAHLNSMLPQVGVA